MVFVVRLDTEGISQGTLSQEFRDPMEFRVIHKEPVPTQWRLLNVLGKGNCFFS